MVLAVSKPYYERYEIDEVVPPESPIEKRMYDFLASGIGIDCKAVFAVAEDWQDALDRLDRDAALLSRRRVVIFPQVKVAQYRADILVAVTDRWIEGPGDPDGFELFFLECDGAEHHGGPNATKIPLDRLEAVMRNVKNDRIREAEIRKITGIEMFRFAGTEITYSMKLVRQVLEAYLEARFTYRRICERRAAEFEENGFVRGLSDGDLMDMPAPIEAVIDFTGDLGALPIMRNALYDPHTNSGGMATLQRLVEEMRERC